MRSYPNLVPLPAARVKAIAKALAPFEFDMMFGNFFDSVIASGAKQAFERSVERYLAAIAPDAHQLSTGTPPRPDHRPADAQERQSPLHRAIERARHFRHHVGEARSERGWRRAGSHRSPSRR